MEGGDGMVAIVQGLRDAGLAVTLLEGCRRYTLIPNSVPHPPMASYVHVPRVPPTPTPMPAPTPTTAAVSKEPPLRCDSSAQASDGRYASIYKMAHCNVQPTSPPVNLTEFPPQRTELCRGHGNFEVGGTGSGETYSPVRPTSQFRGGMSWPDRGSVCAPRGSFEPDSFANSLRKYPNMSPQRSSEVVERLVNYSQAKHASRSFVRNRLSPSRLSECNSNHTLDRDSRTVPARQRGYEPEVNLRPRVKTDESPTREGRPKRRDISPDMNESAFSRNFEVRWLQDISKRARDLRNLVTQQNYQPCLNGMTKSDSIPEGFQCLPQKKLAESKRTVNTEIQAVVETLSREVATLPRVEPSKRNVAVPLSPISSITQRRPETSFTATFTCSAFKSVQTIPTITPKKVRKSVQATSSSIDLLPVVDRLQCSEPSRRKSKSQEELRTQKDDFRKEILHLLESIDCHGDEVCRAFRDELVRKIKKNRRRHNLIIEGRAKSAPFWFKAGCRHCVDNYRKVKTLDIFRTETRSIGIPNDDSLQNAIKEWLQEIHASNSEFMEKHSLDQIVSSLAAKVKHISSEEISKSEIMQMIEEVTFDASDSDRNVQLNNLAQALTIKIKDVLYSSAKKPRRWIPRNGNTKNKNVKYFPFKQIIQPTEDEVRNFVKEELLVFMNKFNLKFNSRSTSDVETDVIDVLIDSVDDLQRDNYDKVKEEVAIVLRETSKMPEDYFTSLADSLVKRYKSYIRTLNDHHTDKKERPTYVVLQNTVTNTSGNRNNITDTSISPVTEADIEAYIERYTTQLTQVIEAWWTSILGTDENEKGFREVAINDLAGDIVDRHRFLDMDASRRSSDDDEVEYLKFQIFRWINKLVGEESMQQALARAPQLMEQIQQIPVPVMRLPQGVVRPPNIIDRPQTPPPTCNNSSCRTTPAKRHGSVSEGARKGRASSRRMSDQTDNSMDPKTTAAKAKFGSPGPGGSRSPQNRRYSIPADNINPTENLYSRPKISSEFENYLHNWVNQIPIVGLEPQLTEKLRRGLHNGVLMALAKAEIDAGSSKNDFYLKDFMEEELENLLSGLPPTQELESKKASLKESLIERATQRTKAIKVVSTPTPYKYRLVDAITSVLPSRPVVEDKDKSHAHLFEEFIKLNIAEDYVLYRLYNETNAHKANAHKDKVLISLEKLYENAKKLPGNERITAMDHLRFSEAIYTAMLNVSSPSIDVLQDEGDQIIIGFEITQWLQNLPIDHYDDHLDQFHKRILRDALAKKIHEIEKQTNFRDNTSVTQVKQELSKFIERFSPRPEEAGNLSYMINEFINKIKNRREVVHAPVAFPWFFQNVPFASSFVENGPSIELEVSLEDWQKEPSEADEAVPVAGVQPPYKEPSQDQWLTLLDTQEQLQREQEARAKQAIPLQAQQLPACCQPGNASRVGSQEMSGNVSYNQQEPYREPSNVEWLTLLDTQERIERENKKLEEAQAQHQQIPPCCQPTTASNLRSQMSGNISDNQQASYHEPSNVEWLTLLDTQEQIERKQKAIRDQAQAQAQQIPPCCQPAVAANQRNYGAMPAGAVFEPAVRSDAKSLHTSQVAGTSFHLVASPGRQVGVPASAPSVHTDIRRLVDLQDQRLSMMPGAPPAALPGPTSIGQPQAVNGNLRTSQMPGPSGLGRQTLTGPGDPCIRNTPLAQRSVRPRQFGSPQQIMSSRGGPSNQSQLQLPAPLAQQGAPFATRHNLEDIPEQNISRPFMSPLDLSIQAPVGFSTPRQSLAGRARAPDVGYNENVPRAPRARRKRAREGEAMRPELGRRRLDLEEEEEEEERERDEMQCRCTERVYRCRRRRPACCDCEDMDYPRYYPMPYPYCYF